MAILISFMVFFQRNHLSNSAVAFKYQALDSVSLRILSMSGQVVKAINAGTLSTGIHNLSLDAGNLPSGTYLLQIQLNNETYHTKIVK